MAGCDKCSSSVTNSQESVSCVACKKLFHASCVQIRGAKLQSVRSVWKCDVCGTDTSREKGQGSSGSDMIAVIKLIDDMRKDMNEHFAGVNTNVTEVKTKLASVNETITGIKSQLDVLGQENIARQQEYTELKKENSDLKIEISTLKMHIQDIEQYSRRDNIEIVGVPYTQRENIYQVLDNIAKVIDVPFSKADLSIAHRLPDTKKTGKPNILVKFVNRHVKVEWINQAKTRKPTAADLCASWGSTKIYLNDHLTYNNKQLLAHLRGLVREKRIVGAWTRDCRVLMRVREDGPVHHILSMEQINKALTE